MRELQIPPRCEGCPRLCEPTEHFNSHAEELGTVSAISPELIQRARSSLVEVLGHMGLSAQEISDNIPSIDDARIAFMEQEIKSVDCMEGVRQEIKEHVDGCPGKLTMRATTGDNGVTYEATICRSPINGADGKQYVEPVITRRYPS